MAAKVTEEASVWMPLVTLDLTTASNKALEDTIRKFYELAKNEPELPAFEMENGWHDITPEMAEELLRRNQGNRKVSLAALKKYAFSMVTNDWKPTGQPLIFSEGGKLEDAQHRLWACYFSGASFPTYVVADVKPAPDLFAYIDDVKPRSAADALYTSGFNGLSGHLSKAIQIAWRDQNNVIEWLHERRIRTLNSREVPRFAAANPSLHAVAEHVTANYPAALKLIYDRPVAIFLAWKIAERFGIEVLDNFLLELSGDADRLPNDSPVRGLILRLEQDAGVRDRIKDGHRLALLVKGFALYIGGKKLTRHGLSMRDNEKQPRIEDIPMPTAEAAE